MHDFFSDTKTKPTEAMRRAVLDCVVGDEQKDEDPTTSDLCARVAELLGKEAAVFLPSGTMCNEIAIRAHIRPGDAVICERRSHIVGFEGGGPAVFSGAMMYPIDGVRGMMTAEEVEAALSPGNRYTPRTGLVSVEQTANMAGGAVWPVEQLDAVAETAHAAGVPTHMDGARLMNAVVASGTPAARIAQGYDTVWIDFTKGLGAPVGAALAGSKDFIEHAWVLKQQFGGAMRQPGVIAAMCLHALDHHVDRLAEDHVLAQWIVGEIGGLAKVVNLRPVDTNIIIFDLAEDAPDAPALKAACEAEGVVIGELAERRVRLVTHMDVNRNAAEALCALLRQHLG